MPTPSISICNTRTVTVRMRTSETSACPNARRVHKRGTTSRICAKSPFFLHGLFTMSISSGARIAATPFRSIAERNGVAAILAPDEMDIVNKPWRKNGDFAQIRDVVPRLCTRRAFGQAEVSDVLILTVTVRVLQIEIEGVGIRKLVDALDIVSAGQCRSRNAQRERPCRKLRFDGTDVFLPVIREREIQRKPLLNDGTTDISVDRPFIIGRLVIGVRVSSVEYVVLKCRCKIAVRRPGTTTLDHLCFCSAGLWTLSSVRLARFDIKGIVRYAN